MGTISYWFYDAFTGMKKNVKNVIVSIITMIATMLIIAIAFLVVENASFIINKQKEAASKITAYLDSDVTAEQIENIRSQLSSMNGAKDIVFTTTEEAIEKVKSKTPILLKGYTDDVIAKMLPPYFTITFESVEAEQNIVNALKTMDGVGKGKEDIKVTASAVEAIRKARTVQVVGTTLLIMVVELSVLLIINSTKLMLYAKRKEISIMKYVGATDGFIKVPFIIQAIFTALIAAFITMIVVSLVYDFVVARMTTYGLLSSGEIMMKLSFILISVGTIIGIVGSSVSMNKYLDV